ncbi:MAG: hypothetical protein II794_08445 [Oscillospiraceae bacterium]|nr:hypothetical protein [Oscillospiraceae bacterium]
MANNNRKDEFDLDEILRGDYTSDESFSLESILSEYNGKAAPDGGKSKAQAKAPAEEPKLSDDSFDFRPEPPKPREPEKTEDEKMDELIREFTGGSRKPAAPVSQETKVLTFSDLIKTKGKAPASQAPDEDEMKVYEPKPEKPAPVFRPEADSADDENYFESNEFSNRVREQLDTQEDYSFPDTEQDYDGEEDYEERPGFFASLLSRFRKPKEQAPEDYDEVQEEEPEEPDPDPQTEIVRLLNEKRKMQLRALVAGALTVIMAIFTFMFEAGKALPFGMGTNPAAVSGVLLILQLLVLASGLDLVISGVEDLIHADPGVESLLFLSNLFTLADGIIMLFNKDFSRGLSFSLVSAACVTFTMLGRISYYTGVINSLRITRATTNKFGVISVAEGTDPVKNVLTKAFGRTDGFYKKLVSRDVGEIVYSYATPILVIAAFLFALISTVGRGGGGDFPHTFAIMMAVTAAFPAASVFTMPFGISSGGLRRSGSALGGWPGACDVFDTDGALISDDDVFPLGSVTLAGIKFFEGVNNQKAVVCASSLIVESQSSLSKVFAELLRSQNLEKRPVSGFEPYEGGGIGGVIDGDRVLCGTGAFMNLMGLRVPEKVNNSGAVFAAVNGELAAVFTVSYTPANSVATSLKTLLNTKVNVLFAVKDFNVTPSFIKQKFHVSMDGVDYLSADESYRLAQGADDNGDETTAIICREGLSPFAEIITKGRLVKVISELNTIISVGGTAVGLLLMFFLCASGSFKSAACGNAFIFMSAIEVCVLLLSQVVRKRA